jgi:hypothetical protein
MLTVDDACVQPVAVPPSAAVLLDAALELAADR